MKVLDLFSGIGGFSLGLERAGMQTVAFCEIDPFCRKVLRKHWPDVPIHEDIRELDGNEYRGTVDVICGGFPCQDISTAGAGAGIEGERSGLWKEYARLIGEVRPRFVIVENVAALLARGLGTVLGDLASFGYDAEWHCIPASAVGAPHRRDRIWIVAYADSTRRLIKCEDHDAGREVARSEEPKPCDTDGCSALVAHSNRPRLERHDDRASAAFETGKIAANIRASGFSYWSGWWATEPNVGRVANGVPRRVDRLRSLGNAVVPQIPELIGRAIMASV